MKALTHARLALLRVVLGAFVLIAGVSAYVSASSLPSVGQTGQALALRAVMHPNTAKSFFQNGLLSPAAIAPVTGRYRSDLDAMRRLAMRPVGARANGVGRAFASANSAVMIDEAVRTFDLFAPRDSNFAPADGPLNPTNLTPVWSRDESFIVFASNRAGDNHTHLFAISPNGDPASLRQITTGNGDEMFPALNATNTALTFTSTAGNGTPNLYVIPFNIRNFTPGSGSAVGVGTLNSLTIRPDLTNGTGFGAVGRPTWAPNGNQIVFAAKDSSGSNNGHFHVWFLNLGTNGYRPPTAATPGPTTDNPPAKLTDGPADDTDPAWSPDGNYIAFASTAKSIATNPAGTAVGPGTSPSLTSGTQGVRNIFLISGGTQQSRSNLGAVPPASNSTGGFDGHVTNGAQDDFGPAWSAPPTAEGNTNQYLNPTNSFEYLAWARGSDANSPHDIFYLRLTEVTQDNRAAIIGEGQTTLGGATDNSVKLNTDDNAGETGANGNAFNDVYPTWSPFISIFSIAYASNRSVTYNDPTTNLPQERAISLAPGSNGVGSGYTGILESQVLNLDPPLLLPVGGGEIVRVSDLNGRTTRNIQPGQTATFTVRLSNREAGTDPNNVYIQIKDPDSKYQDSQGLEHKVFTKDQTYYDQHPNETYGASFGFSSVAFNLHNAGFNGFNTINNFDFSQRGAIGGVEGSDTLSVGTYISSASTGAGTPTDQTRFLPAGQEYECQYVNPTVANPSTATGDYGTPFYLAGIDDNQAFIGSSRQPRPATEWLPLKPAKTDAQGNPLPDAGGGVLYTATYTTPQSSSDFYLDVIAYDNATFPAVPQDTSNFVGRSKNFRIYDNVGGFTTATFAGSNDILVVSDNTLGQKFVAGTFGGRGGSANLPPIFYGAESYFTDIDINLLPNCIYFQAAPKTSPTPPNPGTPQMTATPTNVSATPGDNQVTVVWTGITPAPLGYNVYRSTSPNVPVGPGNTPLNGATPLSGTAPTTYVDRTAQDGTTYYYAVTAVISAGNETDKDRSKPDPSATPFKPGAAPVPNVQLLAPFIEYLFGQPNGPVLNGLGVGSYVDGDTNDNRTVDGRAAVGSQQYSIWRVLSRGPVPMNVLQSYEPTFSKQPAVDDPVTKFHADAADASDANHPEVPVANRCVVWTSPYTGDLFIGAGSILDTDTQTNLRNFVAAGGRLFVSGQDVGSAITQNGGANNNPKNNDFLPSVLNATLLSPFGGNQVLSGASGAGSRISYDAFFNVDPGLGYNQYFYELESSGLLKYVAPSQSPTFELGNDFFIIPGKRLQERTDGSLDQLGPHNFVFGVSIVNGQIDTVTPQNNAHSDITFSGATGSGLVYNENVTSGGGRVVYSSFGLEGVGIEYYEVTVNSTKFYEPRNLRPNILHNVVCYLRTGTYTGTVRQTGRGGSAVAGATVYLLPNEGKTIPGLPSNRQAYSAVTDSSGSYVINGVEPGSYYVVAYKQGFNRTSTTDINLGTEVQGDTTTVVNLNINPVPPGTLRGVVSDTNQKPLQGATVTFTSLDGSTTLTAITDANGNYAITNVPPGPYNGSGTLGTRFGPNPPTQGNPVTVTSGNTTVANFVLTGRPATVTGTVFNDLNGNGSLDAGEPPLGGATITFTPQSAGVATPTPVTSKSDGTYSIGNLAPGSYTVTVALSGFQLASPITVTLQAGDAKTLNIPLVVIPQSANGSLGGLVSDAFNNQALGGASVTITDAASGMAVKGSPFTTNSQTTSPAGPQGDNQPLNYGPITLPPGKYNVTVTLSGFGSQTQTNQIVASGQFTRVDFTSQSGQPLQPLHVFPGKQFNFFSVPFDYSSGGIGVVNQIFGPLNLGTFNPLNLNPSNANRSHLFVWSPVLLQYLVDPTPPADGLHLGQGYWVYLNNPSEVTLGPPNYPAPTTATIPVGLHLGWNMIGVPSTTPISVARLGFANAAGGGSISFSNASSSAYHLVAPTLYTYNGKSYVAVTGTGTMQTWQAYWIYAFADTTVQIPTGGG